LFLYKGQYVYKEDQLAENIYIIYQGECSLEKTLCRSSKQKEHIKLLNVEKGDIMGLEAINYDPHLEHLYYLEKIDKKKLPTFYHSLKSESDNTVVFVLRFHKLEDLRENFLAFLMNLKREKEKIYEDLLKKMIEMKKLLNAEKNNLNKTSTPLDIITNRYKTKHNKGLEFGKIFIDDKYNTRYKPINTASNYERIQTSIICDNSINTKNISISACKTLNYKSTDTILLSYENKIGLLKTSNKRIAVSQNKISNNSNQGEDTKILNKNKLKIISSTINYKTQEISDPYQSKIQFVQTQNSDLKYLKDDENLFKNNFSSEKEENLTDRIKRENLLSKFKTGKLPIEGKKKKYPVSIMSNNFKMDLNLWDYATSNNFFNSGKYNMPLISLKK
jgi:hypothetical protein